MRDYDMIYYDSFPLTLNSGETFLTVKHHTKLHGTLPVNPMVHPFVGTI